MSRVIVIQFTTVDGIVEDPDGSENATLARTLLADLVDRGLDPTQAILFVIDGGKVAEQQFRRIIGYRDLAKLVVAIERHSILVAQ
jgi:hypothetical protein